MDANKTFLNRAQHIASYILAAVFLSVANVAVAGDLFSERSLRVGFHLPSFHEYSREDFEVSVKILTEEMGKSLDINTNIIGYEDIKSMRKDFEQGRINMIFASPLLVITQFDNSLISDGFKMILSGGNPDRLVILTRKHEGMDSFKALRGKKLGLIENDPAADLYVNYLSRLNFHKDYPQVFKEMPREKKSHQIILKLFFSQVDVVSVYENFYQITGELNPQIFEKIQVIGHIDGILQSACFFHKNVDPAFREQVISEVLKLNTYARGRQYLEVLKTDKAIRVTPDELDKTRELYNNNQHFKRTR
jgi:ABC-type phosphate/phosphonate transport system substrate-binding protein